MQNILGGSLAQSRNLVPGSYDTTLVSKVIAGWLHPYDMQRSALGADEGPTRVQTDKLGREEGERENREEREERRKETNSVLAQSHAKADLGNLPQDVNTYISSTNI